MAIPPAMPPLIPAVTLNVSTGNHFAMLSVDWQFCLRGAWA